MATDCYALAECDFCVKHACARDIKIVHMLGTVVVTKTSKT